MFKYIFRLRRIKCRRICLDLLESILDAQLTIWKCLINSSYDFLIFKGVVVEELMFLAFILMFLTDMTIIIKSHLPFIKLRWIYFLINTTTIHKDIRIFKKLYTNELLDNHLIFLLNQTFFPHHPLYVSKLLILTMQVYSH